MTTGNYHIDELNIARDRNNPANILPPRLPPSGRVLDVGCGAGQTLIAAYPDRVTFGLEPDMDAIALGKTLTGNVRFVRGHAETLPFPEASFDLVVARVSLPYTDLTRSLPEIHRVLRPGGCIWMTLHPFAMTWRELKIASYKSCLGFFYKVANSLLFHFAGRQFGVRGRHESFQTAAGMRAALRRYGFDGIEIQRNRHFLVSAKKGAGR